jgi:hypothetical protein
LKREEDDCRSLKGKKRRERERMRKKKDFSSFLFAAFFEPLNHCY